VRGKGLLAAGLVAIASAAIAGSAQGAATIGSNLGSAPNGMSPGCAAPCTVTNVALTTDVAPNGLTSPVNGTVTSWTIRSGSAGNALRLRVLTPGSGLTYTGAGTSEIGITGGGPTSGPFATSLPIKIGHAIGIDNPNSALIFATNAGGTELFWNMPQLADGSARPGLTQNATEVLVQATVQPTNTVTVGALTRNKKKGTATRTITVPNAGQLVYAGTGVSVTGPASVAAPGDVQVTLRATGKKRKKLNKKGKVSVSFGTTFTPNFGAAGTTPDSLTLRKKRKK
jgi:hypothetical protein